MKNWADMNDFEKDVVTDQLVAVIDKIVPPDCCTVICNVANGSERVSMTSNLSLEATEFVLEAGLALLHTKMGKETQDGDDGSDNTRIGPVRNYVDHTKSHPEG